MLHKSKFFIVISGIVLFSSSASSLPWKESLYFGIFGASAAMGVLNGRYHFTNRKLPETCKEVTEFVRQELATFGVHGASNMTVKLQSNPHYPMQAHGNDFLLMSPLSEQEIKNSLKITADTATPEEDRGRAEFVLSIYAALIAHEASHLKNKDTSIRIPLATITIPTITYLAYKGLARMLSLEPYADTKKGFFSLYVFNNLSLAAYMRSIEQQADEGVPNNKQLLSSLARYFNHLHNTDVNYLTSQGVSPKVAEFIMRVIDPFHPALSSRVRRLNERLSKIEEGTPGGVLPADARQP